MLRIGQKVGLIRRYANGRSRIELFTVAAVSGKRSGNILLQLDTDEAGPAAEVYVEQSTKAQRDALRGWAFLRLAAPAYGFDPERHLEAFVSFVSDHGGLPPEPPEWEQSTPVYSEIVPGSGPPAPTPVQAAAGER